MIPKHNTHTLYPPTSYSMHLGRCLGINAIALLTDYGDLVQKVYFCKRELGNPKRGIGIETFISFLFELDWMEMQEICRNFAESTTSRLRLESHEQMAVPVSTKSASQLEQIKDAMKGDKSLFLASRYQCCLLEALSFCCFGCFRKQRHALKRRVALQFAVDAALFQKAVQLFSLVLYQRASR